VIWFSFGCMYFGKDGVWHDRSGHAGLRELKVSQAQVKADDDGDEKHLKWLGL